jgi:hypothetical protein
MAGEDEDAEKPTRKKCTLSLATLRYLEALAKKGTHGSSVPKVMTTLIEQGVRRAIREDFIKKFDD